MHLAFLLPDLRGGGAQKMVINLANWFAEKGHRTDLILLSDDGIYRDLISPCVKVYNFNCTRALYAIFDIRSYIKKERPLILFSALYYVNLISIISYLISGQRKTKIVISERNHLTRSLKSLALYKRFVWRYLIKLIYPLSTGIVGISDGVCQDLKSILPRSSHVKIETIYNPVITDDFVEHTQLQDSVAFPENCTLKVITSGRLVPQKDYPTLIQAFSIYLESDPNAHMIILGTGPLEKQLKSYIQELNIEHNISFCGFVSKPLIYMKQADVFVITSLWEGFCNVIVEALYCGLDVVATDCPSGPSEILENGKFGQLCPVRQVDCIAKSLQAVSSRQVKLETQRARAMDFHVNKIGIQFLNKFDAWTKQS